METFIKEVFKTRVYKWSHHKRSTRKEIGIGGIMQLHLEEIKGKVIICD
jgi:hypothetical protein